MPPRIKRLVYVVSATLLAASLAGCGPRATVSGVVTLDGAPVGPGVVMFHPAASADKRLSPSVGRFGEDGRYALEMPGGRPGCLPGSYIVTVVDANPEGDYGEESELPREPRIPASFASYETSGLTAEVAPGNNPIDFRLNRQ